MLVIDDVTFVPPYEKVCERNGVGDVLVFITSNNGICTKAPDDEVVNNSDCILIPETPGFIDVYTVEDFNANHVLCGLVGVF